ncbi:MAG TPA: WD40 repeat domain-containing protein [Gemmataceae bacterium]|jgi:WD40 repeat protein
MRTNTKTAIQPKELKVLKLDRQLCMIRFSPCGTVLAGAGQDATIRRWDASTDQFAELPPLRGHNGWVQALAFHPDRKRLFAADSWGRLCCWPYADRGAKPLWQVETHDGWVHGLALSPDGKTLATCGSDRAVRLWSADTGAKRADLDGRADPVFAVAFHPDGRSLVSGDLRGVLKVWDVETGKAGRELDARVLHRVDRLQDVGGVRCLAFDTAGGRLFCGGLTPKNGGNVQGTPTVLVFDWSAGKVVEKFTVGNDGDGYVYEVHWHPDGFVMAVTSGNPGAGKFFLQRPGEKQPFFLHTRMANCHSLGLHPDGHRLAVSATNAGSNGNGRLLRNQEYPGNYSPVHLWDLTPPPAPEPAKGKAKT